MKSNFLINLGYGDPSRVHLRNPRLAFEEACTPAANSPSGVTDDIMPRCTQITPGDDNDRIARRPIIPECSTTRKRHREPRAFAEAFGFGADVAVVEVDDVAGDRETESEAAAFGGGVGLAQALENVREE